MPLYFFDVHDGGISFEDPFGSDLASVEEAADQAAAILPDLARDALPGRDSHDFAAIVRDENGAVVYRAALLFRGQRTGDGAFRTAPCPPEADDPIRRSREARAAARQTAARLRENLHGLLAVIQAASRTAEGMRREREAGS